MTLISNEFKIEWENAEINESDLLRADENAEKTYEWFYGLESPPYKNNGEEITVDELQYRELDINGVNSKSDFENYLGAYFSERIAGNLVYKIVNGRNLKT